MDHERAEELYDAFLSAALEGSSELDPETWLDAQADLGEETRAELLARMHSIGSLAGAVARARPESAGRRVGEFLLIERLGGGAMGDVHRAEQTSLGRHVALKLLRAELTDSPTARARIEREARSLAQLDHPHIVRVFGFGEEQGLRYLAMELVEGDSLKERLEGAAGRPQAQEVTRWCAQLARGLAAVHRAGLLHRDVKPSNVRITPEGRPVLVDFGLVRAGSSSELSRAGEFLGSPAYASPEQVRGVDDLDARADVYSLGATLYHALAGRAPFRSDSLEGVLHAVLTRDPEPLTRADARLPRDLELVCAKAMHKQRSRRYADADAFAADLEALLELRPVQARPAGPMERALKWARRNPWGAASLLVVALSVLGIGAALRWEGRRQVERRLQRAQELLSEARAELASFVDQRERIREDETAYELLEIGMEHEHLSWEDLDRLSELGAQVEEARARRERTAHSALDRIEQALSLDPELRGEAFAVRAALDLERYREARAEANTAAAEFWLSELERHDLEGELLGSSDGLRRLKLVGLPPGTRVHLFRLEQLDGLVPGAERRQVPVPVPLPAELPHPLGAPALRVTRSLGEWAAGDLILELEGRPIGLGPRVNGAADWGPLERGDRLVRWGDFPVRDAWDVRTLPRGDAGEDVCVFETAQGEHTLTLAEVGERGLRFVDDREWHLEGGLRARVWSYGSLVEREVPAELELRETWAPLYCELSPALPLETWVDMEQGNFLLHAFHPDYAPRRVLVGMARPLELEQHIELRPVDYAPPGFLAAQNLATVGGVVWMAEFELTSLEYLQFLNDPAVRARIDEAWNAGQLLHVPRGSGQRGRSGMWVREADGNLSLPDDWPANWPVIGIDWNDAQAYCAWRTELEQRGRFRLMSAGERSLAGSGGFQAAYSWGARFDQRFANTCYSRPSANPEPVGNNPRDESPFGIYDCCGNALEWIETWYDEGRGLRHAAGGAWGQSRMIDLSVLGGLGYRPQTVSGETGMRLVWDPPSD